jgi:alkanesulfonate monooxygenase SsuD/methylene tetrahydromethanopterin reductase-like flavin-dependent oxidoreductase (luciferase family)
MRRSIVFATPVWSPLPALTLAAESAGFSRVWTTEGPRRDALPHIAVTEQRCKGLAGCRQELLPSLALEQWAAE